MHWRQDAQTQMYTNTHSSPMQRNLRIRSQLELAQQQRAHVHEGQHVAVNLPDVKKI